MLNHKTRPDTVLNYAKMTGATLCIFSVCIFVMSYTSSQPPTYSTYSTLLQSKHTYRCKKTFGTLCFLSLQNETDNPIHHPYSINETTLKHTDGTLNNESTVNGWEPAPYLNSLQVRHKLWDSGGDVTHLQSVQAAQNSQPIRIMVWGYILYSKTGTEFGAGNAPFKHFQCPVSNCEIYNNRLQPDLYNQSDALVFFGVHYKKNQPGYHPKYRLQHQKWIFYTRESPSRFHSDIDDNDKFNLTMTYHHESDILWPYGRILPILNQSEVPSVHRHVVSHRRGLAVWMASNCDDTSLRRQYVTELTKHIKVDVYGKCGNLTCKTDKTCLRMLKSTYKFYLSFENSLCEDYVTEKLFRTLRLGIVPVVLGGANYSAILPQHSYIDVRDFKSARHLGLYLSSLDSDDDKYNQYFRWQQKYKIEDGSSGTSELKHFYCGLCHGLHVRRQQVNIVHNIRTWWAGTCLNRTAYYKGHVPQLDEWM